MTHILEDLTHKNGRSTPKKQVRWVLGNIMFYIYDMIEHKKLQWPNYPPKVKIRFKSRPGIGRVDHQEMEVLILYSPTQGRCKAYVRASPPPKQPCKGTVSYSISMFEVLETVLILVCVRIYHLHIKILLVSSWVIFWILGHSSQPYQTQKT